MTFAISISKIFFQKKLFAWNCLIRKDHRLFFRFAEIFQFFVMAPHQQFFEIFDKVEFLHDHEELGIDNGDINWFYSLFFYETESKNISPFDPYGD